MAKQTKTGKAFEYALLTEFYERLKSPYNNVQVVENRSYDIAQDYYNSFDDKQKGLYSLSASFAINFLIDIEPRLSNQINEDDLLQLEIVSDSQGQSGDVRDVLAIRLLQKWEIGISAKNNHRAVKHSRLSPSINFAEKWFGVSCSEQYFSDIEPVFSFLAQLRQKNSNMKWVDIPDMHHKIYVPILDAFKSELLRLCEQNPDVIARKLVEYLIGTKDFYKVIKQRNSVEIQAYNLRGSLNKPFRNIKPKHKIPKVKLPYRLIEAVYDGDSKTTLIVSLNEGWQISFRIHSASSKIEPSLKFDINLISSPYSLFTNHMLIT